MVIAAKKKKKTESVGEAIFAMRKNSLFIKHFFYT